GPQLAGRPQNRAVAPPNVVVVSGGLGELASMLFGQCELDEWPKDDAGDEAEPWQSFVQARAAFRAGDLEDAERLWRQIAATPDLESRHVLQAWYFLRMLDVVPPHAIAKHVLGAVAEVAVERGHDVLAAYEDGSVRYLNASGAAVVVDARMPAT